ARVVEPSQWECSTQAARLKQALKANSRPDLLPGVVARHPTDPLPAAPLDSAGWLPEDRERLWSLAPSARTLRRGTHTLRRRSTESRSPHRTTRRRPKAHSLSEEPRRALSKSIRCPVWHRTPTCTDPRRAGSFPGPLRAPLAKSDIRCCSHRA